MGWQAHPGGAHPAALPGHRNRQRAPREGPVQRPSRATGASNRLAQHAHLGRQQARVCSLLKDFEGKIDLIYIDPPFDTGDDFSFRVSIGDEPITKLPSIIEVKAYNDMWASVGSYLQM